MPNRISRSTFLKAAGATLFAAASWKFRENAIAARRQFPCRMLGPSMALGHKARDRTIDLRGAQQQPSTPVIIVGGGMAGLSAAWWLKKNGCSDFVLLELEKEVGGNSRSGSNQISAYPWGAHYVPLANNESEYVRTLFQELGIITSFGEAGEPIYNDLYLCHDPQERLLKDGSFQDGLVPKRGLQESDKEEIARFFELMRTFRNSVGSDGKHAFAIPIELSSGDDSFLKLDKLSMSQWLNKNNFRSKQLLWYINYCCRDDYGSTGDHVSAWAGIHYFAGRRGTAANAEQNSVVTWPEGNGFIVSQLRNKVADHIRTGSVVASITQDARGVTARYLRTADQQLCAITSKYLIFAAPRFVGRHVIAGGATNHAFNEISYAPWLVANITLKNEPQGRGMPLCWDNVSYKSESLGYVVATHQNISTRQGPTVITYYYPLSASDPVASRTTLSASSSQAWRKTIVEDLEKMHPGITEEIVSMDLWPWGHGMVRPSVGFMWSETRKRMQEPNGRIFFAHSDMSGMSNFEEAQYRGIEAAKDVISRVANG